MLYYISWLRTPYMSYMTNIKNNISVCRVCQCNPCEQLVLFKYIFQTFQWYFIFLQGILITIMLLIVMYVNNIFKFNGIRLALASQNLPSISNEKRISPPEPTGAIYWQHNVCTRVTNCFSAHERVILVFISRVAKQRRKQIPNNTRVSAETVRHESKYITSFLTRRNESINDDKKRFRAFTCAAFVIKFCYPDRISTDTSVSPCGLTISCESYIICCLRLRLWWYSQVLIHILAHIAFCALFQNLQSAHRSFGEYPKTYWLVESYLYSYDRGRFKNAYKLLNIRALIFSPANEMHILRCMGTVFYVKFQKGTFEISHKISCIYIERCIFDTTLKS